MGEPDYRSSHQANEKGAAYALTYKRGYYAAQWRHLEEPLLRTILGQLPTPRTSCLDFACGTGRITQVAADYFDSVTAVDVSSSMLKQASARRNVAFLLRDLTKEPLNQHFDAALAFRFFLNADAALRTEALNAMRDHLKVGGYLLCNVHMASSSPMGLLYRSLAKLSNKPLHKTLGHRQFTALLARAGFRVESTIWYGFLPRPGPLLPTLCELLMQPFEKTMKAVHAPNFLAQCFLVVARKG